LKAFFALIKRLKSKIFWCILKDIINLNYMGKRKGGLQKKEGFKSHKTKKRLEKKYNMLTERKGGKPPVTQHKG